MILAEISQVDPWIAVCSLITVVITVGMGFWSAGKSKNAGDFFVAGRSVSVGWNASAISGEYLSAASFMGVAGMVMARLLGPTLLYQGTHPGGHQTPCKIPCL